MKVKEQYHGWVIELVSHPNGYSFHCWTAQERIGITDRQLYSSLDQALTIAKKRADLETMRWALTRFLDDACLHYKLNLDEMIALEASILEFVAAAFREDSAMPSSTEVHMLQATCELFCAYKNTTSKLQVVRITNISGWYFEKVVFPQEQLLFEALPEAELEIYTGTAWGATLVEKICCSQLKACIFE
ncbi:MAG: DUF1830 domain-containing protein [Elainella sp. C42_A2020_010]|nr:DUF1830 domain-containing protein [Elainella sp. C42_A2020_010]